MKKILLLLCFLFSLFTFSYVQAEENGTVKVKTSEKIPGLDCTVWEKRDLWDGNGTQQYYECRVQKGAGNITGMLWAIIKYFTFLAGIGAVLFIVVNGIMYSMGGIEVSMKDEAKKRIIASLIWLALLMLSWVFLNMVAPWVYK